MKKLGLLFLALFVFGGGLFYAFAGDGGFFDSSSSHFVIQPSRLEVGLSAKADDKTPFFVSPTTLPSFTIARKGKNETEKLNICRIDLKNPGKWLTLGISHLDTTSPAEVKRWVDHNAEYFPSSSFIDTANDPYEKSIGRLQKDGVVKGYADNSFHPQGNISRAEFLKIVTEATPNAKAEMGAEKDCFGDTKGHWGEKYICYAKNKGFVKGKNDGSFHPDDSVSYAEALKILYNIQNDRDVKQGVGEQTWFEPFVTDAQQRGIEAPEFGVSAYSADTMIITRGQMAELLVRYLDTKHPEQKAEFVRKFPVAGSEEALKKIPELSVKKSDFSAKDCAEFITVDVPMDIKKPKTVFDLNTVKSQFKIPFGLFAVYLNDDQEMQFSTRYFAVMNAGVLLKKSESTTFAWVFDPATGTPLKNAKVYGKRIEDKDSFWNASDEGMSGGKFGLPYFSGPFEKSDKKYQLKKTVTSYLSTTGKDSILLGTTNDSGMIQIPASSILKNKKVVDPNFFLIEHENAWGVHLESWKESINPRWFPDAWDNSAYETEVVGHIYTDRTMFRPGHTVNFKGVMFQHDAKTLGLQNLPEGLSVTVKLQKPYDDVAEPLATTTVKLSKNSSFSGSFVIPANAELGDFQIFVTAPKGYEKNYTVGNGIINTVRIEEYRRPTFYLNLLPEKHEYFTGETATIKALTARYAGGGIGGGKLSYRVTARPVYETDLENGGDGFQTEGLCTEYEYSPNCQYGYFEVTNGEIPLDKDGNGTLSLPLQFQQEVQTNLVLIIEATVKDSRGEETTELSSIIAYHQKNDSAVRPALKIVDRVQKTGSPFEIQLKSKNYQLKTVGNKPLKLVVQKAEEQCEMVKDLTRGERKSCTETMKVVEEKTLNTDANGNVLYRPVFTEAGKYLFAVTGDDKTPYFPQPTLVEPVYNSSGEVPRNGEVPSVLTETLWVVPTVPQVGVDKDEETSHQVELSLQKETFHEGEMAKLVITSPFPKAKVLITLEGNQVFDTKILDMVGNIAVYEFPVTKDMTPNIQVGAFLVETGTDIPRFKIGYQDLNLSLDERELTVTVTPEKPEYQTGENITLVVKTTDKNGKPVPAEVSIGVVDEALVRMAGQVDTNFLLRLFPRRYITLTSSTNLLAFLHDHFFSSFGGAGKGGVGKNIPDVRKDFKEVLYWNPAVQTDANGNAKVSFPSGESLTSYIALSAGFSTNASHKFGFGEGKLTVNKDFVLQPDLPRFLREGDSLSLTTRIVNTTNAVQTVTVSATASILATDIPSQSLSLAAGETKTVSFPVTVPDASAGKSSVITFVAKSANGTVGDAIEVTLPIETQGNRTLSQRNLILGKGTETLAFAGIAPENFESLSLSITNSSLTDLKSRALKLLSYPYGCAEQTTSSTMPNAIVASLQKELGESPALAEHNITAGFARLKTFQRTDGGFSLWENETESNPSVSAMVGGGLAFMKDAGYTAPASLLDPFQKYLKAQVSNNKDLNRPVKIRLLYVGITLGAFSETDAKSYLQAWYDQWKTLSGYEKTDLALAFAKVSLLSDADKKKITDEVLAIPSFTEAVKGIENIDSPHYFDGADGFAARQVRAALALDPTRENLSALVQKALNATGDDNYYYFSSSSEAEKLLSAYEYALKSGKRGGGDISLTFGGKTQTASFSPDKANTHPFAFSAKNSSLTPLTITNTGDGPLYVTSTLVFTAPPEKLGKSLNGMKITRTILDEKGNFLPKNAKIELGKTYQVQVTFSAPSSARSLAVSVPLPAGFEITTDYNGVCSWNPEEKGCKTEESYNFQHIEHRDNRADIFPYDGQKSGTYTFAVRPIASGKYSFPPATAVAMYDPKYYASTDGMRIEMK
ncbi:MAG: S-layer homology domain-containing protein [Candidatus Peregrinibacteria bacterium]